MKSQYPWWEKQREHDKRGSASDRRARKRWLLSAESGFGGDGTRVPCIHCKDPFDYDDLTVDRIEPGGSYGRHNVQPACMHCNCSRQDRVDWTPTPKQAFDEEPIPEF